MSSNYQAAFDYGGTPDVEHGYLYIAINKEMLWVKPGKSNTQRTLSRRNNEYHRMGFYITFYVPCPAHFQREQNLHDSLADQRAAGKEWYRPTPLVIKEILDHVDAAILASPDPGRYTRDRMKLASTLADMYRRYMDIKSAEEW